ncbi:hypothetical protein Hanom_Chr02g00177701 [Helianthus anomalus]
MKKRNSLRGMAAIMIRLYTLYSTTVIADAATKDEIQSRNAYLIPTLFTTLRN